MYTDDYKWAPNQPPEADVLSALQSSDPIAALTPLYDAGLDPNYLMGYKGTLLIFACGLLNPALVSFILDKGAHPDFDTDTLSPLKQIIGRPESDAEQESRRLEIATILLKRGANPDDSDALWHCATFSDLKVAELIFEHAAEKAKISLARLREENKAKYEEVEFGVGTPLHRVAEVDTDDDEMEADQLGLAKLYVQKGADAEQKDSKGRTALEVARISENVLVVEYLEGLEK